MLLFSLAFADQIDPCQVWVSQSVPSRDAVDLPLDLAPVLFTYGGCDSEVRIDVAREDEVVASTTARFDTQDALEVASPGWSPGSWSIELYDPRYDYVLDRIDFTIGEHATWPTPDPPELVRLDASTDGEHTWVEVVLGAPIEEGVLELTLGDGTRTLAPANEVSEAFFRDRDEEGEQCMTVAARGPGGPYSAGVDSCATVRIDDPDAFDILAGCGRGCDQGGGFGALALFGFGLLGLRRR